MINNFSNTVIPAIILLIIIIPLFFSEKDIYSLFINGAKDGLKVFVEIVPTIFAIVLALEVFKSSGALNFFTTLFKPIMSLINIPDSVIPLVILRPISGSGSLAILKEIIIEVNPDSYEGRLASVIMGSSETIFYTIALYLTQAKCKKTGLLFPIAFIVMLVGIITAVLVV